MALMKKLMPAILGGAMALSAVSMAQAAAGFKMINPEDLERESPGSSYYLYGENGKADGGHLDSCTYGKIVLPDGVNLRNIKFYFHDYSYFRIDIWRMTPDRTGIVILLDENIGDDDGKGVDSAKDAPDVFKYDLSGTISRKNYLYTLKLCGYGDFYGARIKYTD